VKELNMFHSYETEKITRKASDGRKTAVITSCSVLLPEIVMQNTFNVWSSADICGVRDDLGWKNWTARNCWYSATSLALRVIFLGGTTEQHVIISGFGELAAVD